MMQILNREILQVIAGRDLGKVTDIRPVSGGDINAVYRLQTATGKYLLKVNPAKNDMFLREQEGLLALAATKTLRIPKVYLQDKAGDESFLLLEWIENKAPGAAGFANLGRQLAELHRHTSGSFGFGHDNYIGPLHQSNKQDTSWATFFITKRLRPLLDAAIKKRLLDDTDQQRFDSLYEQLPNLFEPEPPALVHGDLWSGNFLIAANDEPCLVDPAVYYGHREMDIAMTTLFGGFGPEFYKAYHQTYPLTAGWKQRLGLWNLYPLLVHVNLFGGGYVQQLSITLKSVIKG